MIKPLDLSFATYLGVEQQRLFASRYNLGPILQFIQHVEDAHKSVEGVFRGDKEESLLLYSRTYLYKAVADFARGRYSSAYAAHRNALECAIHHFNIFHRVYSIDDFVAQRGAYRSARRKRRKSRLMNASLHAATRSFRLWMRLRHTARMRIRPRSSTG